MFSIIEDHGMNGLHLFFNVKEYVIILKEI